MGELINLNSAPLIDTDIPAAIARDTEVTSAIAAHVSAANPHPIYLTQAKGDTRYALSKVISITTLADPTRGFGTPHGLNFSKICGYTGIIESAPTTGSLISPNNDSNSGFRYSINCDAQNIYFLPATTYNSGLASKPLRFIIFYLP